MANPNSNSNKWPRINRSTYGLPNIWYQSKDWGHLRRRQHLESIQRELKRENQDQIGSCMKQISEDCKKMLKNKMKEEAVYSYLNHPKRQKKQSIGQDTRQELQMLSMQTIGAHHQVLSYGLQG
ncbi:hypothetical protein Tco_1090881 [Tanacetum coccineum]|uniref:Uncharacterized protein n=1 Tax=Tanacetum coccineum TaxID=301880 RepID=A0ABQ5I7J7_9ASTR